MKLIVEYLNKTEKEFVLAQFTLGELYDEMHRRAQQDDDEDLEEGEEEDETWEAVRHRLINKKLGVAGREKFKFRSEEEELFTYQQLSARYPHEITRLVEAHLGILPSWLKKEILERREKG